MLLLMQLVFMKVALDWCGGGSSVCSTSCSCLFKKKLSETLFVMTLFSTEKTYGALRGNVLNDTFLLRWFGGDHRNRKFFFSPLFSTLGNGIIGN